MVDPNLFMIKLAEQADRFEDMLEFLKPFLKSKDHFTPDERNMLSVAFKNLVTPKRTTWRQLQRFEQQNVI